MSIKYNGNSITVPSSDQNKNLVVYSHPGDDIRFDFDISSLNKKIVNGDLVIYLLNGRTITLVNFGLMALDNKAPTLSDITQTYTPFSLFDNSYYYKDDSGVTPYLVSRTIASPDNNVLSPGTQLPSSKELFLGEWSFLKNNAQLDENGNTNNNEVSPAIQEFIIKTLFSSYIKLEQSMVNFTSNSKYRYNEPDNDIFPIKLLLINPKITPEYGTLSYLQDSKDHKGYNDLTVLIGGGKLQGNDYAHFMYEPEIINLKNETNKVWFDGYSQTNMITRWFYVGLPTQTVIIDKVIISGLPRGIKIPKDLDKNLIIRQFGGGNFEITVRGSHAGGVEIPLQYLLGLGGEEGLYSAVNIIYEGTQTRTGDAVRGSVTSFFEFKPVRSADDVSNFDKFNTFTYSTLRDPLIIWFTDGDDVIKGGKGNYTYYGNAGNNKAYGGEADEIFHLGVGSNSFYAGLGNTTVDVDNVNNQNSIYLSDAIGKAEKGSVYTTINNGKIYFGGKYNGKTFTTIATDFTYLYFDIGDNNTETVRNDELIISTTKNLKADIRAFLGNGDNVVKGHNSPMTIEVKNNTIFIRTDSTLNGVFINWDHSSKSYILGSLKNDIIRGSNIDVPISFDGSGRGENTADYSDVTFILTYDASTGVVNKKGNMNSDTIKGIKTFIGGLGATTFYGSTNADIKYIGSSGSIEVQNTLSYIKLESGGDNIINNGVTIDLVNSVVRKHKTKGVDVFFKIGNLQSSNNNDTFIISNDPISRHLDGMGGFNTVDYSQLGEYTIFNIYEKEPGTVEKGENGQYGIDTIKNFQCFIGSSGGSTFKLQDTFEQSLAKDHDSKIRFFLTGKAYEVNNIISYSAIRGKSIVVDLKPEDGTATIYSEKSPNGKPLAIDKLSNIGNFFLTTEANNIIYAYDSKILEYYIDGGVGGNNIISFERSKKSVDLNFSIGIYNNIVNINKFVLSQSNDTVIMGPYCFVNEIDGFGGVNKVDFTNIAGPITFNIKLTNIEFNVDIYTGKNVKFKKFQHIVSTFGNDIYKIEFDLKNIDQIKNKNIFLNGNLGSNTIDFDNVLDGVNKNNGLIIDLSQVYCSVKDIKGNNVLEFTNFTNVFGSRGGDTFILPKGNLFFEIDGNKNTVEGAVNSVSYQAYITGVYINKDIFSKFKNIQKIIGSQGNDIVELDKDTSFNIDGYDGFNTLNYFKADSFEKVKINISIEKIPDIGLKSLIIVDKGNGKTDILRTIGYINFEDNNVTNGVEFYVNNKDNILLNKNGKVFLSGSKVENGKDANSKIIYKEDLTEITLNLHVEASQLVNGSWIYIKKGTGDSVDYLQNISSITLSKSSTVNIFDNIGNIKNVRNLMVNGRDNSILSFEYYSMGFELDVSKLAKEGLVFSNNTKITFEGFTKFIASRTLNTKFTFISASDKNYTFYGLESQCTLIYKNLNEDITINVSKYSNSTDNIFNNILINKGKTTDIAYNIVNFIGSQGVTKVLINYSFHRNMSFTGSIDKKNENSINYSGLSEKDSITFIIHKEGVLAGRSSGEYNDIIKNINNLIGGAGNTRFIIENDVIGINNVYKLDGKSGVNTLNLVNINTNIKYHLDTEGKINVNINNNKFAVIQNIHILFGTCSKQNEFKLGNFFEGKYFATGSLQLYGSNTSDTDVLDLTESNKSFYLDPLTGRISQSHGNANLALVTVTGISKILLGDGNHQIDITNKTSNVGWKEVVGGKGQNNVSFDKLFGSIHYNLAEGVDGLSFQLINFTGVTGTKNNDTFYLIENKIKGIRINGNGGLHNILDYSRLNVAIIVDVAAKKVTRGDNIDTVENISIFKSGSGGGHFISTENGFYEFYGLDSSTKKSVLDYSNINSNLLFSFTNNSVIKSENFYDKFYNVTEFIGGSGEFNNFLFALGNLSKKVSEIIINGGKGKNNIINLAQLEKGITYDIDKQFFEVDNQGTKLKVILKNINALIGSSHQDIFIFTDTTNGIRIDGGNNTENVYNIIDLSKISNSVTINFVSNEILYGNNKNHFTNVNIFRGSKKGGDIFKGLNNYIYYDLTGGDGGNNTVMYNNCSAPITIKVENEKIVIFKGGVSDVLRNIQKLSLTDLSDKIILDNISDLKALSIFQVIDGGLGDNEIEINFKVKDNDNTTIDLSQGIITHNNAKYNISLKNFRDWSFSEKGFNPNANYTIIAPKDLNTLRLVRFAGIANYLKDYYNTLNIKDGSGSLYLSITENIANNIKMLISGNNIIHSVHLENVTKIILPKGVHFINYDSVVYKGEGNSFFNLKIEADFATTEINYNFEVIQNDVGKTYICFDGIKFSEKGTKLDILFNGKPSNIAINRLISPKDNVVFLFGSPNTENISKFSIFITDITTKDNTIVLRNLADKVVTKDIKINFLTAENISIAWGKQTLNTFLVGKNNLYTVLVDPTNSFKEMGLVFSTTNVKIANIIVDYSDKEDKKYIIDFSDIASGVYAKFDFLDKYEFYSYNANYSESNKFFTLFLKNSTLISNSNNLYETNISSKQGNNFYEFIFSDKKLPNIQKGYITRKYTVTSSQNSEYTAQISLVKQYNELNFPALEINILQNNVLIYEAGKKGQLLHLSMMCSDSRISIIFNVNDNFTNRINYLFHFNDVLNRSIKNVTLPNPNIASKLVTSNDISLCGNMFDKESATNIVTIFNISYKNNEYFADMQYMFNNDYNLTISNIKLTNNAKEDSSQFYNKFLLSDIKWYSKPLYNNILYFQASSTECTFLKCINKSYFALTNGPVSIKESDRKVCANYMIDATNMTFGFKDDIPNLGKGVIVFSYAESGSPQGMVDVQKENIGGGYVGFAKLQWAYSINIQRIDVSFPVAVKLDGNTFSSKFPWYYQIGQGYLFSFGDMQKMRLPNMRDYQIFTTNDKFVPANKRWNGQVLGEFEKTYTNVVYIKGTDPLKPGENIGGQRIVTFDLNSNTMGINCQRKYTSLAYIKGCNCIVMDQFMDGIGYLDRTRETVKFINNFNNVKPFAIYIQKSIYAQNGYRDSASTVLDLPHNETTEDVVIRVLRGGNPIGDSKNCSITLTNNYNYDDPNFKYYGSVISAFAIINVPDRYIFKYHENRDKLAKDITWKYFAKVVFNQGIYSFEGVDKGDKAITCGITSAVVIAYISDSDALGKVESWSCVVTDFQMLTELSGNISIDSLQWSQGVIDKVKEISTEYTHVKKFIITNHKNNYDQNDQTAIQFYVSYESKSGIKRLLDYVIQRDIFKGDVNDKAQVDKYLSDFATVKIDPGLQTLQRYMIMFNEKNIAIRSNNNLMQMLLKNACAGSKYGHKDINDMVFYKQVVSCDCIFTTDLFVPDLMQKGDTYYFGFRYDSSQTKVTVRLPYPQQSEGYTYNYNVEKLDTKGHKYMLTINLLDLETGSHYSTYKIKYEITNSSNPNGIVFKYNTRAEHMQYIIENCKDLYELTKADNENKKDLDKIKDTRTGETYISWDSKQTYLDNLDTTVARQDYWKLIDKQIADAFKIKTIDTNSNANIELQQNINSELLDKKANADLEKNLTEDIYFVDNDNTNHSNIFEANGYDKTWEKDSEKDKEDNYYNNINNTESQQDDTESQQNENITEVETNHSYQYYDILDNKTDLNSEQNTHPIENIDLSSLFEKVKSISNSIDHTTLVEEFGLSEFTLKELNHTYQQDEANSMSYTIDGCNNIASNYSNDYNIETTIQENQKNKTNH